MRQAVSFKPCLVSRSFDRSGSSTCCSASRWPQSRSWSNAGSSIEATAIDADALRTKLSELLAAGDFGGAAKLLQGRDTLETNIVLAGIKAYELGPESAEELIAGALGKEKARYEKRLNFLATLASNAPYVGLFGTVLGIVRSFRDLAANMADASSAVMAGIAESLIATAVGLLVAIPAVVAFNVFKARVKSSVTDGQMLARTLMSQLKAVEPAARQAAE